MHPHQQAIVDPGSALPSMLLSASPDAEPSPASVPPTAGRTAKARLARIKHGLNSKFAVIPGEDVEAFRQYRSDTMEHLRPQDPLECGATEQMIVSQWHLQRVWKIQTGVFEKFERDVPDDGGATHPMRLAQCFMADTAAGRTLDKMSMHQMRLINAFHKSAKLLLLVADLREKGLTRPAGRRRFPNAFYAPPEGLPLYPIAPESGDAPSASLDSESSENADRGAGVESREAVGNDAQGIAPRGSSSRVEPRFTLPHPTAGVGPARSLANGRHGEGNAGTAPMLSSDDASGENADRGAGEPPSAPAAAGQQNRAPQESEAAVYTNLGDAQEDLEALEAKTNSLRALIDRRIVAH